MSNKTIQPTQGRTENNDPVLRTIAWRIPSGASSSTTGHPEASAMATAHDEAITLSQVGETESEVEETESEVEETDSEDDETDSEVEETEYETDSETALEEAITLSQARETESEVEETESKQQSEKDESVSEQNICKICLERQCYQEQLHGAFYLVQAVQPPDTPKLRQWPRHITKPSLCTKLGKRSPKMMKRIPKMMKRIPKMMKRILKRHLKKPSLCSKLGKRNPKLRKRSPKMMKRIPKRHLTKPSLCPKLGKRNLKLMKRNRNNSLKRMNLCRNRIFVKFVWKDSVKLPSCLVDIFAHAMNVQKK
uniref:Nucleolin-like n=1 Tax=Globodera pallida TaxID=36090 RepID=A0A183BXA7_GLOPA